MDAEQIVGTLAATDPRSFNSIEQRDCGLCWTKPKTADIEDVELLDPANHEPGCPWRLAREWVAQHRGAMNCPDCNTPMLRCDDGPESEVRFYCPACYQDWFTQDRIRGTRAGGRTQ